MGERYYQPDLGRFLTRDPIGQAGGINVYSYAGNNPINNVDPDGLDTFVFNGTILKRYSSSGPTAGQLIGSWPAASGFPGTGRADQTIYHRGPLPEGTYHFNIADVQQYSPNSLDKISGFIFSSGRFFAEGHSGWGDYRVELVPDVNTMRRIKGVGRTAGFFLHGGDAVGSAGCIDIGHNDKTLLGPMVSFVDSSAMSSGVAADLGIHFPVRNQALHKVIVDYSSYHSVVPGSIQHPAMWPQVR